MVNAGDYICPYCGGELVGYDHTTRFIREEYGIKRRVQIKRMRCKVCRKVHNAIPADVSPYKQYRKDIVEGFRDGSLSTFNAEYEDCPSELTIKRWKRE